MNSTWFVGKSAQIVNLNSDQGELCRANSNDTCPASDHSSRRASYTEAAKCEIVQSLVAQPKQSQCYRTQKNLLGH